MVVGQYADVGAGQGAVQGAAQPAVGQHFLQPVAERAAEAEQSPGLVVHDGDPAVGGEGDDALADAVQHRLAVLQQAGDLLQLQAERGPFQPPRQQIGRHRADRGGDRGVQREGGELVPQLAEHVVFRETHRHLAGQRPRGPVQRDLAVGRPSGRALVGADVRAAVLHHDRFSHRVADQVRYGVRVPYAAQVDHDHVRGPGRPADPFGDRLHHVTAAPVLHCLLDLRLRSHGPGDVQGPLFVGAVEFGPLREGEKRVADQSREREDDQLVGEDPGGKPPLSTAVCPQSHGCHGCLFVPLVRGAGPAALDARVA